MKYENGVENKEIENLIVQSMMDTIIGRPRIFHKEIQAFLDTSKVDL